MKMFSILHTKVLSRYETVKVLAEVVFRLAKFEVLCSLISATL